LEKYDLVILLGSQIKFKGISGYMLAPHTELKAKAAGIAWREGITRRFIISGGYNFWVRYDESKILETPDLSFKAFTQGRMQESEARVIAEFLERRYKVLPEAMFLEELSATTHEQAEILGILLKRKPTFTFAKKIAILTLIYHMQRALPIFQSRGLEVEPLFAEDLLVLEGKSGIKKVCQYYSTPKEGKQWPVERIRELLSIRRSIGELLK